jgi:hypothetical protein
MVLVPYFLLIYQRLWLIGITNHIPNRMLNKSLRINVLLLLIGMLNWKDIIYLQ